MKKIFTIIVLSSLFSISSMANQENRSFAKEMETLTSWVNLRLNTAGTYVHCGTRDHFEDEINNIKTKFKISQLQVVIGKTTGNYDQDTKLCAVLTR